MASRSRTASADKRHNYTVETQWSPKELEQLATLEAANDRLPVTATRVVLSVRLSVLTDDTTSVVRQELDLRTKALERGCRVVGVARDLNVSATKVPPWKRRELGEWLNNRTPEYDEIWFWKLDRFVRSIADLATMISWCAKYNKNLVSLNDPIDLSSTVGQIMVTIIAAVAEIEVHNTSTRVTSLWEYTKTQSDWLVGKPAYGYTTHENGDRVALAIDEDQAKVLRWCWRAIVVRGLSTRRVALVLIRGQVPTGGRNKDGKPGRWTTGTLLRRLRNPALMGYRVMEAKGQGSFRRSQLVLGTDGQPIRVADGIFTQEEFDALQKALDARGKNQPTRTVGQSTRFLGVLVCADCGTNLTVHKTTTAGRYYEYLRCRSCPGGGAGAPNPQAIYDWVVQAVLTVLGDEPVLHREYACGAEIREKLQHLDEQIKHYMKELAPGGRYTRTAFTKDQAERTLNSLISELQAIDPDSAKDRWVNIANGRTYREHWEDGGLEAIEADLVRVGIKCEITRTKVPRQRAPKISAKLVVPKDVRDRLVIRQDDFSSPVY